MSLHQASETLIRFALMLKNLEADNKHSMNGVFTLLVVYCRFKCSRTG